MTDRHSSLLVAVIFVALLVLLTDPFMLWMPPPAQMVALLGAAIAAALWAGLVFRENHRDEREAVHKYEAGRIGYLAGVLILSIALVVQGLGHAIDGWITLALGVMVIAKIAARRYFAEHH